MPSIRIGFAPVKELGDADILIGFGIGVHRFLLIGREWHLGCYLRWRRVLGFALYLLSALKR